ncbi:hypothetical protein WJX81_006073 [Elliptochloris bilobata]|uniref:Pyrimidine 5-nucleotidase n=1 Tax=Elliptochloris bilobata TaxID=381761 RepID=A0AAW1RXL0_9CHLO
MDPDTIGRPLKALLIDLDDTLYQDDNMPRLVKEFIQDYMHTKLGIPQEEIPHKCYEFYSNFGTTMAGLAANNFDIDEDDWHAHVHHRLPYTKLLQRDEALRDMLASIKLPKYVFTNADRKHAHICLELLGIADLFEGVICYESVMAEARRRGLVHKGSPIMCKPNPLAVKLALEMAGADAATTAFFDDSTRNVAAGRACGLYSVLVGRTGADSGADLEVASMHDLRGAMPGLWAERPHAARAAPAAAPGIGLGPGVAAGRRELRRQSTAELIRQGADEEAEQGFGVPLPLSGERGILVPAQE